MCKDISTIDSGGDVGTHNSITTGSDGLGLITYHDVKNGSLKIARCLDAPCTVAKSRTVDDSAFGVGLHTSIVTGADGFALISYYDAKNGDLKVAHCADRACVLR